MASEPLLSACLITRDEERDLPGCLATLGFCDEIVVVDSGSTDATVALAQAAGARVVHHDWPGFGPQRNAALDHARGTWVLEIDADERVDDALRAEIEAFVASAPAEVDLGAMPRRELLAGHALGPSAKYPNYCHRLLRRGAHRHDEARLVHEGLVPHGPVHPFTGELRHLTATTWRIAVRDAWRYARLEAEQLTARPTPAAVLKGALLRPLAKLAYRLIVDGAWRDGPAGLAKVGLDTGTDSVVWLRAALGARQQRGDSGVAASLHYGARRFPEGEPKVVALALDARAAARAESWAQSAAAEGLDVALATASGFSPGHQPDAPASASGSSPGLQPDAPRVRAVAPGILSGMRALDHEEQLRTIDVVVPFGRRARLATRLAPSLNRGLVAPHAEDVTPAALRAAVAAGREALRS